MEGELSVFANLSLYQGMLRLVFLGLHVAFSLLVDTKGVVRVLVKGDKVL